MTKEHKSFYSEEELDSLEYLDMPEPEKGRLHSLILQDPISQLRPPKPIVLGSRDPVSKAVKLMKKFRFGSVFVLDKDKLIGIFTEKDLVFKTSETDFELDKILLEDVMTPGPQALDEEDSLSHALNLMSVGGYRHIIVLRDGKPVGFVSIRGILKYITENALSA